MSTTPFADRLRLLRTSRGLSQPELAEATGIGQSTISRWEKAEAEPVLSGIRTLADFFSVTADYLIGRTDQQQALRPGDWLVDLDDFDAILSKNPPESGYWACPVPPRHTVVDPKEYARMVAQVESAREQPRKKRR